MVRSFYEGKTGIPMREIIFTRNELEGMDLKDLRYADGLSDLHWGPDEGLPNNRYWQQTELNGCLKLIVELVPRKDFLWHKFDIGYAPKWKRIKDIRFRKF